MLSDEISVLEPLSTPVPSKVRRTEPLTIPVPSVENDSDMNPNAVIWAEPLIVPSGVLSPLLLTNPNDVI